jgi:phosphoglycolate phosphatase
MMNRQALPEAVLFDLDGTLVDSVPDMAAALGEVMVEHGLDAHPRHRVATMIGHGVPALVSRAFAAHGRTVEGDAFERAVARYMELYEPRATRETRLFEGVSEAVRDLHEAGVRMAVCTNKPGAVSRDIVEAFGLSPYMGAVIGGDAGPPRKPEPDLLLLALETLGVAAARSGMIGDSGADVAAARAAGLPVVVVEHGYTSIPAAELGADRVIASFHQLRSSLEAIAGDRR